MLIDLGNKALLRDMLGTNLREVLPVNRMSRIQRIGAKNTARKFPEGQIQKKQLDLEPVRPLPSIVFANGHICSARMSTSTPDAAGTCTAGIPVEDLEPAAGLSSASSCIKLSLLGSTFRPAYLHQVFPDERIPGWRPTAEAEMEARATAGVCMHSHEPLSVACNWYFVSALL